jgi:hypothetical protein
LRTFAACKQESIRDERESISSFCAILLANLCSPFLLYNDYLYYGKMLLYYTKNKWVKANSGKRTFAAIAGYTSKKRRPGAEETEKKYGEIK